MPIRLLFKHPASTDLYQLHTDDVHWDGYGPIEVLQPTHPPVHTAKGSGTPATALSPSSYPGGNGALLMIYKAGNSNDLMWSWFGLDWSGDEAVHDRQGRIRPPKSDHSPSAAVFRNHLFLVYKNETSSDLFAANMDFNGVWSWGAPISSLQGSSVSPKSDLGPSVAVYQDKLYIVYKGQNTKDIFFTIYDGQFWSGDARISSQPGGIRPESSANPSLVVFNNLLYMIYKGPQNNDLNYAYFDGKVWHGNSEIYKQPGRIRPESNTNPGLAVFNGRLHMIYKSPNNNELNVAFFDGATWSGNTQIRTGSGGVIPLSDSGVAVVSY
jgi:hypothetical protein